MWTAIIELVAKIAIPVIDYYLRKVKNDEEMLKSYYEFLDIMDKKGHLVVRNRLKSLSALEKLKARVRKRRADADRASKVDN